MSTPATPASPSKRNHGSHSRSPPADLHAATLVKEEALDNALPESELLDDKTAVKLEDIKPADLTPSTPASPSKPVKKGPQLIGDLPRAEDDAKSTFTEIEANHYQYGTLGRSREALESMTCDCVFNPGESFILTDM